MQLFLNGVKKSAKTLFMWNLCAYLVIGIDNYLFLYDLPNGTTSIR